MQAHPAFSGNDRTMEELNENTGNQACGDHYVGNMKTAEKKRLNAHTCIHANNNLENPSTII